MAWIVISEADLLTRVSGSELTALRSAALGENQADPIAAIITQITDEIQGYIPANVTPPSTTSIPARALSAALDRIVWEIMKRPGASIMDDANSSRAKANAAATALFKLIADGTFKIENPDTGASATNTGSQTIHPPKHHDDFKDL